MDISNTVFFVTGASSGIGAATARAASRAGARVILIARRLEMIQMLAESLPNALAVQCDVTDREQVTHAVQAALATYGRIDVLINNAGRGLDAPVSQIEVADFLAILELNLLTPLTCLQAVLPTMRQQGAGSIVNVSSGVTFGAVPGSGAYAASKAALNQLGAVARAELTGSGIVVSTVFPFLTRTDFFKSVLGTAGGEEDLEEAQSADEVAQVILGLVRSGDATADLVPEEFGGTYVPA